MRKYHSLHSRTLWLFALWMVAILLLSTPVFYLLTKQFYAEDIIDIIEAVEAGKGIPALDLEKDILEGMTLQFMLIFVIIAVSMLITLRLVNKRLWWPFHDMLDRISDYDVTKDEKPEFSDGNMIEFRRLNDAIDNLIMRDREAFRVQKEFTENASHELQTPLAVTRSRLDLLMQEPLSEEGSAMVAKLYETNLRMERLNRNLLLLAKIDNHQYTESESIELASFIRDLSSNYESLYPHITLNIEGSRMVKANRILLECLVNNLVANAIRHIASNESHIELHLTNEALAVSNESISDTPLDVSVIFQRFHSGESSNKGTGLGLSIVKAICDYHGWTICYSFENKKHLLVELIS